MKILYFHQHFSTPQGSSGTRSYELARYAVEAGHQVTMVCGSYGQGQTGLDGPFIAGKRRGMVDGIDVFEFDLGYSNVDGFLKRTVTFLRYAFGSSMLALTESYDVCFATTTPLTSGIPGIAARWLRRKPFVFEVRDLWPELPRAMGVITNPVVLKAMSVLEFASYRSAHRLVALSPGIARGIEERGVPKERIALVPNGCDLDLFGTAAEAFRPKEIPDDHLVAIFTGTHGQANGLDAIIDGAAELKRRGRPDIVILLVGTGKLKQALIARARNEAIENVRFLDPVPKHQVAGLLRGSDLGIQSLANVPAFYFGTSPNKFFDYIAAGLPVLNNYPGWIADMIGEEDCGFAIPPDDPVALANALEAAADDRAALAAKGRRARDLGERVFGRRTLAESWLEWVTGAAKG